jgi:hypothetical protein
MEDLSSDYVFPVPQKFAAEAYGEWDDVVEKLRLLENEVTVSDDPQVGPLYHTWHWDSDE